MKINKESSKAHVLLTLNSSFFFLFFFFLMAQNWNIPSSSIVFLESIFRQNKQSLGGPVYIKTTIISKLKTVITTSKAHREINNTV